jgi:pSer/pThr/pTyr-binding forkhead associated (FHA) protein
MVKYEFYEGGYTFLHPVRKRQTNPNEPGILLGRSTGNDLIVPVPSISNMHLCFLPPIPGSRPLWNVKDNGSSNGTWLNDRPVKGDVPVKVNDRIVLGAAPTALIVVVLEI